MRAGKEAHQDQMEALRFNNQQQMEDQRQRADAQKQGIIEQGQKLKETAETSLRAGMAGAPPGIQKAYQDFLNSGAGQTAQSLAAIQKTSADAADFLSKANDKLDGSRSALQAILEVFQGH
jgi:hypothetical protein